MAHNDNNDGFQRQMFQGNWTCSQCGAAITELPFEPDPARVGSLTCRDCHRKVRNERRGGVGNFERRMFQGNWTCSDCGTSITELPFEPSPERLGELKCRDCHRKSREM